VEQWRQYRNELEPVRDALRRAGVEVPE
jgi:hypothetical protein